MNPAMAAAANDDMTTYADLTGNNMLRLDTLNASPSDRSTNQGGLAPPATALRARSSKLSKYGVSFQPPKDDALHYPSDARSMSFFEKVNCTY